MSATLTTSRPFVAGSVGWTASDLDDPAIERAWASGNFEIVEGVLATMPPAYFAGGLCLYRLMNCVTRHLEERGIVGLFSPEVDVEISEVRVPKADAVLLFAEDMRKQEEAAVARGKTDPLRTRLLIPPPLIIESVSPGHELHDRRVKREWYAEFGVQNYWILDAFARTLECLRLEDGKYVRDVRGDGDQSVQPGMFPGLVIALGSIWL